MEESPFWAFADALLLVDSPQVQESARVHLVAQWVVAHVFADR